MVTKDTLRKEQLDIELKVDAMILGWELLGSPKPREISEEDADRAESAIEVEQVVLRDDVVCFIRASEIPTRKRSFRIDHPFQNELEMFNFACDKLNEYNVPRSRFGSIQLWMN